MSDISWNLPGSVNLSSFADDFRVTTSHPSIGVIKDKLSEYLEAFERKLERRFLALSFPRTQLLIYNYKASPIREGLVVVPVGQNTIRNVIRGRYLGVTWDVKLNWEAHVTQVRKKAGKLVNILAAVTNLRKGAHPETVLTLYKGLVRPTLEWAGFLFNTQT